MKIAKRIFLKVMFSFLILLTSISFGGLILSCNSSKTNNLITFKKIPNSITIASSIPRNWPQYKSILAITKDWNEKNKNTPNFKKVVFLSREDTNTQSYNHLSSIVNKRLRANSSDVPEILISNFSQVHELAAMNKLLDLRSEEALSFNDFESSFISQKRKNLGIENYKEGLWAVPLTVTTNSSLVFNIPVMKKIIGIMQKLGMKIIGKNNPFINKIQSHNIDNIDKYYKADIEYQKKQKTLNSFKNKFTLPSKIWQSKVGDSSLPLQGYKISDDTFKYYESLFEFAKKAKESLKTPRPIYILGSYFYKDFISILDSKNGATDENFPLFRKRKGTNIKSFEFPFLNDKNEQQKIKDVFNIYHDLIKNKIVAKPENFNIAGVRNGQYAFSTMPSVSARYSYKSDMYGSYTNNGFDFFDIKYLPQITKFNKESKDSYSLAESSLMVIKKSPEINKEALKFINFLYKGKTTNNKKNNDKYIFENSGYFIPLKNPEPQRRLKMFQNFYKDLTNPQSLKEKGKKSLAASYRSIINILESNKNYVFRNFDGDQYTSKLLEILASTLNKVVEAPDNWDADKFIGHLKTRKGSFDI